MVDVVLLVVCVRESSTSRVGRTLEFADENDDSEVSGDDSVITLWFVYMSSQRWLTFCNAKRVRGPDGLGFHF